MNGDIGRDSLLLSEYSSGKHKKKRKKKKLTASDEEILCDQVKESIMNNLSQIDYVLVHSDKPAVEDVKGDKNRTEFERLLQKEGVDVEKEVVSGLVFSKLHVPFSRLCKEAERVNLRMPLKGGEIDDEDDILGCCGKMEDTLFNTDDSVDFISAPFIRAKIHLFDGYENEETFFNRSLRAFLTHHILINLDIRSKDERFLDTDGDGDKEEDLLAKRGLPYLLHKGNYSDAFTLHDESLEDPVDKEVVEQLKKAGKSVEDRLAKELKTVDTRKELNDSWPKVYKYQPMWKVRNYFGEKIAFYFAWSGTLVASLWIPTLIGLGVFIYGLYQSATESELESQSANQTTNTTQADDFFALAQNVKDEVFKILDIVKAACDNEATPFFSLVMCLWGTIYLEVWKRKSATLAYEWDVNDFEDAEPDRPQYFGTTVMKDPVSGELAAYYPIIRRFFKFCFSCVFILVMILVVFISVGGVIVYRVIMSVDYCGKMSSIECLLVTTIASSLLNAISIFILGKIYEILAYKLTDWENHRTQTDYDDALIIKLFAFQFANNYSSLFYIAFLRGNVGAQGILGLGPQYADNCGTDNNCMAMLSFQVLILMIVKPFPKLLKDILLPFIKKCIRNRKCCKTTQVNPELEKSCTVTVNDYLDRERLKPVLGDFTLWEYTEKVIQYGYLMLFAVALPIAPLIALLTNLFDRGTDAKRLLWIYRRPISYIAQDIGMWFPILRFINIVGVISNAFIICFTTTLGREWFGDVWTKLIAAIVFEHVVFGLKYLIEIAIPDVPSDVRLAMRREKYQVSRILETGQFLSDNSENDNGGGGAGGDTGGRPHGGITSNAPKSGSTLRKRHDRTKSHEENPSSRRVSPEVSLYPLLDELEAEEEEKARVRQKKKKKKRKPKHDDPEDPETPRRSHHLDPIDSTRTQPGPSGSDMSTFNFGKLPRLVQDKSTLRDSPTWQPPPVAAMPAPVYMGDTSFDVNINSSYA